jgi:hypothetical protein
MKFPSFARSLRFRLLAASLAIEVIMLIILVGNSLRLIDQHLIRQTESRVTAIELAYKTAVALPLAARDYATLRDILDAWRQADDITYLVVTDPAGKTLAASGWSTATQLPTPKISKAARFFMSPSRLKFWDSIMGKCITGCR